MTITRIYYSVTFGVIIMIEADKWFSELSSAGDYWTYIGEL
jgi:hypothetical protein